MNINFHLCQMAEKAMMYYCPNLITLKLDSPSLFINTLYNQIINLFYSANSSNSKIQNLYEILAEYRNTSITLLQFALCEYDIYSEYNQIIIALASCLICAKEKENENNKNENIYQNIVYIIKNILKVDISLIEECMSKIINNFNSEENSSDEKTSDEESPIFNFHKDNIISLTNIIENEINFLESKEQN